MFKRSPLVRLLLGELPALMVGCSSASDSSTPDSDNGADQSSSPGEGDGAPATDCPGTEATINITETDETAELTHAGGVSLSDGAAYTVYVADSEIDSSKISMVATPEPEAGHRLVTVAITIFDAGGTPSVIAEGTEIPYTPDFGVLTFRVTDDTGDQAYNSSAEAAGRVTMTKVGEAACSASTTRTTRRR
ncbi:MAG: hypothetical protein ABI239_01070 [Aquihabitans sp.]